MELRPKSFFASKVSEFQQAPTGQIVGALSTKVGLLHSGSEREQILAWEKQIILLKNTLLNQTSDTSDWGILIELQLLRLRRRIDTVLLIGDQIACIEFKIGGAQFNSGDIEQTNDYALCLRDFHSGSHGKTIYPILCCDQASTTKCKLESNVVEGVSTCLKTNAETLPQAIVQIAERVNGPQINYQDYDASDYNPTPNIVSAARDIYAGHTVQEIGRCDANGDSLQQTAKRLNKIATEAHANRDHTICFVTGEPGAGKTLLGLDLVFSGESGRVAGEPAALLSGNRPLVAVLQEAIAIDAKAREGISKQEAKRKAEQALQNLLGYLKEHAEPNSNPPEHVIVFDEAQRAWDADTGKKLLDRNASEPELFLEILGRLDWCCLVCLVGPGQEINRGEEGLALWGKALSQAQQDGYDWKIHISPQSQNGTKGLLSQLAPKEAKELHCKTTSDLHLVTNLRAYRNDKQGMWVEALLDGDLELAKDIADEMKEPPAYITRDLDEAKQWLRQRQRGNHRVGLLASSGATRLIADGIPPSPISKELKEIAHWFLQPAGDFRSSNALERPLSEFACQGLEIDYACLCWGNDLIWTDCHWTARKMSSPRWQNSKKPEAIQYRLNAYRVLLTRSRAGMIIYVPNGDSTDSSRNPLEFDGLHNALVATGCEAIRSSYIRKASRVDYEEIINWLKDQDSRGHRDTFYCNRGVIEDEFNRGKLLVYVDPSTSKAVAFQVGGLLSPGILEARREHRGLGIGKLLVEFCIGQAVKSKRYHLEIQCCPESSIPFWRRMGFTTYKKGEGVYAYQLLEKTNNVPKDAKSIQIEIRFYKDRELLFGENDLLQPPEDPNATVFHKEDIAYLRSNKIYFPKRISFFHVDPISYDLAFSISIDGKLVAIDDARSTESIEAGFEKYYDYYYLDTFDLNKYPPTK